MSSMVALSRLTELWIHTGTACNLQCPFCLEGSSPGDTRLDRVRLAELKPFLDEAVALGVQRFCFTGGEPLIVKDIVKILEYALSLKPCLVLSNGTAPLLKRAHQLQLLSAQSQPLSFRISIDYPDARRHDEARGWGNFERAIEGLQVLHAQGFEIGITRQREAHEDSATDTAWRELLRKARLPATTPIIALPDFGRLGTEPHLGTPLETTDPASLMCSHSRMLVKRAGQLRVYACPFTDDDTRFELGSDLGSAAQASICLQHQRCAQCCRTGASLSPDWQGMRRVQGSGDSNR